MRALCAVLICFSSQLCGCKRSDQTFTTSDVLGLYTCNIPEGFVQSVELRRDGTYVQSVVDRSENRTYSGEWKLTNVGDEFHVEMYDYHFEWPSYLRPPLVPGIWSAGAMRTREGSILLAISAGYGLYCTRSSQPG